MYSGTCTQDSCTLVLRYCCTQVLRPQGGKPGKWLENTESNPGQHLQDSDNDGRAMEKVRDNRAIETGKEEKESHQRMKNSKKPG